MYKNGLWAEICAWFGLKGVGPREGATTGEAWVMEQKGKWSAFESENVLKTGTVEKAASGLWFMSLILVRAAIDHYYDFGVSMELGFPQNNDTAAGYHVAFERLRMAKQIP